MLKTLKYKVQPFELVVVTIEPLFCDFSNSSFAQPAGEITPTRVCRPPDKEDA
jgi:hypothetical protein